MDSFLILKCINDVAQVLRSELRSEIQQQHIVHTIEMRKMQERIKQLEVWGPITNEIRSNACLLFACNEITSQTSTDYNFYLAGDEKYVKLPLDFVYTGDATKAVYYFIDKTDWDRVVATRISEFDARPPAFAASDYDDKITMTKEEMALDDFGGNRLVCWIDGTGELTFDNEKLCTT